MAVLRRIGRTLGEREGTSQDDEPFLRKEREQSRTEGMRAMLNDLAVARLGTQASEGLATLAANVDDPEVLLQAGKRLVAGATANELADVLRSR